MKKQTKKNIQKLKKQNPGLYVLIVVICLLIVVGFVGYVYFIKPKLNKTNTVDTSKQNQKSINVEIIEIETSTNLSIHFLAMDNKYSGDAIYIKVNDIDILVDAGSRQYSAQSINNYLDQYVEDNTLEYVIATHADQDHIAGFVGTTSIEGVFDHYTINTLIDFNLSNKEQKEASLITKYYNKRESCIQKGMKHYTALDCVNETNGASKIYQLSEDTTLEILYNYFYEHKSSKENNYSVCFMLTQAERHFLFTGDLEEKGEEYLVEYNDLVLVELFKAGHHGSPTSSTSTLLEVIKPKVVVVTCCAGSEEYTKEKDNQFPSQAFIDRIKPYTNLVFVTNMIDGDSYKAMNGNVIINSTKSFQIVCTNNDITLFETEWFKQNRK